jgi:hypothetical protein
MFSPCISSSSRNGFNTIAVLPFAILGLLLTARTVNKFPPFYDWALELFLLITG